ncbi:hypothetical protein K5D34_15750 [Pseudomonas cichorii]|uniref:hypothetical protein n=1 Tax=Pseudomonas syringae group TaxID=136849 RepID=UPI001910568F|nr:hypothetical protein [Pseudomonas cichorii]MBX8511141.1 hypothetical protein [Pseudomonas cichorii]MBX8525869.1 hypothetical protein [Pseudomonas cichorii]MBX8535238.1 hypothetical protein [Pseudomonas cichorii]MBX8539994.1 hypothetical protein [Pseudomonas cichorii]MBX8544572.1 hypothetical protein [Pseudomonas cichorii]
MKKGSTFAVPGLIAVLTGTGLFMALLGDNGWDILAWVGMGIAAGLSIRGLMKRR